MKLYKTAAGILLQRNNSYYLLQEEWDIVVNKKNLHDYLSGAFRSDITKKQFDELISISTLPPIGSQEVWAAGVTYLRSRDARMEESEKSGGADFYDKVYGADRPELFFKGLARRASGMNEEVYIRKDSSWNVPEPELTLYINSFGEIQGYTIGNDMSSRSIEGENPLYLPQAKVYERSLALGPCLYVPAQPLSPDTTITIRIHRKGKDVFKDSIQINRIKRKFTELVEYLYRELIFPDGCYLMTGTGMVPPSTFTLQVGDEIYITIDEIGTLHNIIGQRKEERDITV